MGPAGLVRGWGLRAGGVGATRRGLAGVCDAGRGRSAGSCGPHVDCLAGKGGDGDRGGTCGGRRQNGRRAWAASFPSFCRGASSSRSGRAADSSSRFPGRPWGVPRTSQALVVSLRSSCRFPPLGNFPSQASPRLRDAGQKAAMPLRSPSLENQPVLCCTRRFAFFILEEKVGGGWGVRGGGRDRAEALAVASVLQG